MVEWRQAGVIVNPVAGINGQDSLRAARRTVEQLGIVEVATGPGALGGDAFAGWTGKVHIHDAGQATGREQTYALANKIASCAIDVLIVVGGDGTLADVARALLIHGARTPILGVGAGSTNVGQLITCRRESAEQLRREELEVWSVHCLLASVNGKALAMAFNDVVLGHTIVGILNGKRCDLEAVEHMEGRTIPGKPRPAGCPSTRVTRQSSGAQTLLLAEGTSVAGVVVGFADSSFFGKAITGGICLATLAGLPAGCIVSDTPLVQIEMDATALQHAEPIASRYVSLANGDRILIEGVNGAALCADGNPCWRLEPADRALVSVCCDAVVGVRSRKDLRSA